MLNPEFPVTITADSSCSISIIKQADLQKVLVENPKTASVYYRYLIIQLAYKIKLRNGYLLPITIEPVTTTNKTLRKTTKIVENNTDNSNNLNNSINIEENSKKNDKNDKNNDTLHTSDKKDFLSRPRKSTALKSLEPELNNSTDNFFVDNLFDLNLIDQFRKGKSINLLINQSVNLPFFKLLRFLNDNFESSFSSVSSFSQRIVLKGDFYIFEKVF